MQQRVQGTSRERMLREMAEAAELFTLQRGLVVVLEDLHWSDVSTLDWLMYMARLWRTQNKEAEARQLLEEVYGWFTEGFDTKDLQEAEALVIALGGSVKTEEERQKAQQTEGLRLKAEEPPPTITLTQDIVLTTPAAVAADGNTGTVVVRSAITIEGQGRTISRTPGAPEFRLLRVASEGKLTVRQTTLRGGQVTGNEQTGGGLLNEGSVTLEECTISGNTAHHGGRVESRTHGASQMTLSNSMVSGNSAVEDGGGVRSVTFDSSHMTLSASTVSGNSALVGGRVYSDTRDTSQTTLQRTLAAGNEAPSGAEVAHFYIDLGNGGGVFTVENNLFGHSGLTTADALMGVRLGPSDFLATSDSGFSYALPAILDPTLAHNGGPTRTHNLVTDSLAIDAAETCELTTDQRGAPRPQGSACDIGAVEFQEICGNCKDDDGDGRVDFIDPDCMTGTSTITTEQATFTLTPTPRRGELTLTATLPGGKAVNPPRDGLGVQFSDASGSLLCVHLPPAGAAPKAWKSTGSGRWTFTDAPNGSRGAPSKDAGTVSYNPSKNTLTVQMTIKETEIGGTATVRTIQTGVGSGKSRWRKGHRWTPKLGGTKLGTP